MHRKPLAILLFASLACFTAAWRVGHVVVEELVARWAEYRNRVWSGN
jgi:purine nucleoside permease